MLKQLSFETRSNVGSLRVRNNSGHEQEIEKINNDIKDESQIKKFFNLEEMKELVKQWE